MVFGGLLRVVTQHTDKHGRRRHHRQGRQQALDLAHEHHVFAAHGEPLTIANLQRDDGMAVRVDAVYHVADLQAARDTRRERLPALRDMPGLPALALLQRGDGQCAAGE